MVPFQIRIAFGRADQDIQPLLAQSRRKGPRHFRKERMDQIGNKEADQRASSGDQAASSEVRPVAQLFGSLQNQIPRFLAYILMDVYMVTHPRAARAPAPHGKSRPGPGRVGSWIAAVLLPLALAALLLPWRGSLGLSTVLLIFLLGVLGNALIGGVLPAAVAAVTAGLLANYFYTPPFGSFTITHVENAFALVVFVIVGVTVASVVDRSSIRARQAAQGKAEAQLVAAAATSVINSTDPVHAVLEQARIGFGMQAVQLLATVDAADSTDRVVGSAGVAMPVDAPDSADVQVQAGAADSGLLLAMYGRPLPPSDLRLVEVFAAQSVLAVERVRMTQQAHRAERLRQTDSVRTAVLAALSHDLRTPLATIKASVSSLRDRSITWTEDDQTELLAATDTAADQLDALLENLLDLSRLQTGAVVPLRRPASVDEVVHRALIGIPGGRVTDTIPDDLPLIDTDAGLLERVIANITFNAVRYSPAGEERAAAGRRGHRRTRPACADQDRRPRPRRPGCAAGHHVCALPTTRRHSAGIRCRTRAGRCPRAGRRGRRDHRGRRHPGRGSHHDRHACPLRWVADAGPTREQCRPTVGRAPVMFAAARRRQA